jgi:hypothetical protein
VGFARANNFSDWISSFAVGELNGFGDDPDGDGMVSGLENFFGTSPDVADAAGLRSMKLSTAGVTSFTFTHPENANPADDLSAVYQWSAELESFHDDGASNAAGTTVNFVKSPDSSTPNITTVTATITGSTIPESLFVRVKVTPIAP